jgi:hypothetical protein
MHMTDRAPGVATDRASGVATYSATGARPLRRTVVGLRRGGGAAAAQ